MDKTPDVETVTKLAAHLSRKDLRLLLKKIARLAQVNVAVTMGVNTHGEKLTLRSTVLNDREIQRQYQAERASFQAIMDATPPEEWGGNLRQLMSITDPQAWLKYRREYYPTREELWSLPQEERERRMVLAASRTHDQHVEMFDAFGLGDEDMDEAE